MSTQRESELPAWGAPGGQGLVLVLGSPKAPKAPKALPGLQAGTGREVLPVRLPGTRDGAGAASLICEPGGVCMDLFNFLWFITILWFRFKPFILFMSSVSVGFDFCLELIYVRVC